MEKILTIVIPTYNMQDYLRRCLDSLIVPEEQMQLLEVLVVNDGSKDNSSAIAHEYQDKYPDTFRVIDKENGNYGSCVNRGLKEATGKYIKILDADDWFDKTLFQDYLKQLCLQDVDIVLNDCYKVNKFGRNCGAFEILGMQENKVYTLKFLYENNIFPQMHCIAYRTELLRDIDYHQTEGISYTDQEWVSKPMSNTTSIVYFRLAIYNYMVGREGQTMDRKILNTKFSDHVTMIFSILDYMISCTYKNKVNLAYLQDKMFNLLYYLYKIHIVDGIFANSDFNLFDSSFQKKYPNFYSLFNNKRLIRLWHKQNRCFCYKMVLKIYSFIQQLKSKL